MRLARFAGWFAGALVVLALIAAALLFWASRSETVLRWGVDRFADRLPCRLQIDGLRGAITEPLDIGRIVCENDEYRVEARAVRLEWAPWHLRQQRLRIVLLRAAFLEYVSKTEGGGAPDALALPLTVDIDSLAIEHLRVADSEGALELRALRAAYQGDARMHRVTLQGIGADWGSLQGDLTLGAAQPLPLEARLRASITAVDDWPIEAAIEVSGPLARPVAVVNGTARDMPFSAQLELTPFADAPVEALQARTDALDLAALDARLPQTALTVDLSARTPDLAAFAGTLSVTNPQPGPIDRNALPLAALQARFSAGAGALELTDAMFDLGHGGRAAGSARYRDERLTLDLDVRALDLRRLHGSLRETRLTGRLAIDGDETRQRVVADLKEADIAFEGAAEIAGGRVRIDRLQARTGGATVRATGTVRLDDAVGFSLDGELRRFDPSRFGDFPKADINGRVRAAGHLRPTWQARIDYRLARSRYLGHAFGGDGVLTLTPERLSDADLRLRLGRNTLVLNGSFGAAGDTMRFELEAPALGVLDLGIGGSLSATGTLSGTRARPAVDARFSGERIAWESIRIAGWTGELRLERGENPTLAARSRLEKLERGDLALEHVDLTAGGVLAAHRIEVQARGGVIDASARLEGGFDRDSATWRGSLAHFENAGDYAFEMLQPAALELAEGRAALGATRVNFSNTEVVIGETRYAAGALSSSGAVAGVRLSRLIALMEAPPALQSSVVLGARWSLRADETLEGELEIAREDGDIVIPGETPIALGLTQARLAVSARANAIDARLALAGARLNAQGRAQTRVELRNGGWGVAGTAPLRVELDAQWKSIRSLVALLAGDALTGDGSLSLRVRGDGTVAEPRLEGTLAGDNLAFEQVASGVFLREGQLRARFGPDGLTVSDFRIRGGEGSFAATGRLTGRESGLQTDLEWSAQQLTVVQHPDLRLTVSGAGILRADERRIALAGQLTADRGRVELRGQQAPSLGSDVVVVGREQRVSMAERALNARLDLKLDLGPDFRISGRGIDARLTGQLTLSSPGEAPLEAIGEIRVAEGSYSAYGQRLNIDRGEFYFRGPVDNPGLLIRALRKNQPVEAGVEVSGTARNPQVQLVSNPDVPDAEKLSWLVLGRPVESGSRQDAQALQSAAVALAAGLGTSPLQRQLAGAVGLDELRVGVGSEPEQGGVVALGKRVSDKIYVSTEYSLSTATNTLRVSYQLARRWSLRTESGKSDAVDLFYTISFD